LGGDEFAVLLPETSNDEAVALTSRMLEDVRNQQFDYHGNHISFSFSAGVAEYQDDSSVDDWIRRGDARLYKGKSDGRARVVGDS
jgi:diguanylate cyclase (GGDEF)-like protein